MGLFNRRKPAQPKVGELYELRKYFYFEPLPTGGFQQVRQPRELVARWDELFNVVAFGPDWVLVKDTAFRCIRLSLAEFQRCIREIY